MVLHAGDKHTAVTSLRLLHFTKRFHFLSRIPRFSLHPVCRLPLTPARGPKPAGQDGHIQVEDLAAQRWAAVLGRMPLGI